ncbi:hypothetical protein B0H21DRAFT_787108, partial [Amylocystis lapponica]
MWIPGRRVVGRTDMWEGLLGEVKNQVREDLSWEDQEKTIRHYIKKRLRYAILSHRWLPKGEVTFDEVGGRGLRNRRGEATHTPGLYKLDRFLDKALEFNCNWAWADTCCINKRNSAELDESIRSMYRWYQNASVCIVHLRDTQSLEKMDTDKWFGRGWTLQELLAPKRLKFYTANWESLRAGPRDIDINRARWVSKITGIPTEHLQGFRAGVDMVREKLVWASRRKTTRLEDMAYSLVGMFSIDLQIAYGEGERAFYRLQKAIMEQS